MNGNIVLQHQMLSGRPSQKGHSVNLAELVLEAIRRVLDMEIPIVQDLIKLGAKTGLISEVIGTLKPDESIIGSVRVQQVYTVIFTTHRVISIARIPLAGKNLAILSNGIKFMGGNFHLPFTELKTIRRQKANKYASMDRTKVPLLNAMVKAVKTISSEYFRFQFDFLDKNSAVLNRIDGLSAKDAAVICDLARRAGLMVLEDEAEA
jgi:hypothetical protein